MRQHEGTCDSFSFSFLFFIVRFSITLRSSSVKNIFCNNSGKVSRGLGTSEEREKVNHTRGKRMTWNDMRCHETTSFRFKRTEKLLFPYRISSFQHVVMTDTRP